MIKFQSENIFRVGANNGIDKKTFQKTAGLLALYIQKIHSRKQGFYKEIDDKKLVTNIKNFAKKIKWKFSHIVILGIGGSALGVSCLRQSLKHLFENELKNSQTPKLHVLDNIDPNLITELEDVIEYQRTLFIVISKSGGTPETVAQYFYFRANAEKLHKLDPKKHFVFITDPKKGFLRKVATAEKIPAFEIPENIGGRFSVLTHVGLLPAALIGINIEELLAGARALRDKFLSKNFAKNLPFQLAAMQYLLYQKGKNINVMMPYVQKLALFADWYRQLLAESIGKKFDRKGKIVNIGLTPANALGVTDQHSQLQLYNEGPNDKLFILLKAEKLAPELSVPGTKMSFNQLLKIEQDSTTRALTLNKRPNLTIILDKINEKTLGELFMLFEGATAFLGEFFNINAFDQPGVELSKELTKKATAKLQKN